MQCLVLEWLKLKKTRKSKSGGSFLSSLKSVGKVVAPIASHVGKEVVLPVATDMAKQALTNYMTGSSSGTAGAGLKNTTKRGQLIKQVMTQQGCNLGQASKYIKEHQLM